MPPICRRGGCFVCLPGLSKSDRKMDCRRVCERVRVCAMMDGCVCKWWGPDSKAERLERGPTAPPKTGCVYTLPMLAISCVGVLGEPLTRYLCHTNAMLASTFSHVTLHQSVVCYTFGFRCHGHLRFSVPSVICWTI